MIIGYENYDDTKVFQDRQTISSLPIVSSRYYWVGSKATDILCFFTLKTHILCISTISTLSSIRIMYITWDITSISCKITAIINIKQ